MCPQQGLLRGGQVTAPETDLANLVERHADRGGNVTLQFDGRLASLRLGLEPVATPPLDPGTEDAAHAGIAIDPLAPAPAVLRLGPFGCPTPLAEGGARLDRRAAHAASGTGVDFTGDGGDRGLVDEHQAFGDVSFRDQRGSLLAQRQRLEVAVLDPARDVEGAGRLGQRRLLVAGDRGVHRARRREPAVADPLGHALEQPTGPTEPRLRDVVRVAEHVVTAEQDGGLDRGVQVIRLDGGRVGTLPRVDRDRQPAGPPRRLCEEGQLRRTEPPRSVLGGEEVVRLGPGMAVQGRAGAVDGCEVGDVGHRSDTWNLHAILPPADNVAPSRGWLAPPMHVCATST